MGAFLFKPPQRKKGFILATTLRMHSTKGSQGKDLEVGTVAEAIKGAAYWHALHGWLSLLSYETQNTSSGVTLSTVSWAFLHLSSIKKMHYKPFWWGSFTQSSFLFSNNYLRVSH